MVSEQETNQKPQMEVSQIHALELLIETISNLIDLYKTNTNQNRNSDQLKNFAVVSNPYQHLSSLKISLAKMAPEAEKKPAAEKVPAAEKALAEKVLAAEKAPAEKKPMAGKKLAKDTGVTAPEPAPVTDEPHKTEVVRWGRRKKQRRREASTPTDNADPLPPPKSHKFVHSSGGGCCAEGKKEEVKEVARIMEWPKGGFSKSLPSILQNSPQFQKNPKINPTPTFHPIYTPNQSKISKTDPNILKIQKLHHIFLNLSLPSHV